MVKEGIEVVTDTVIGTVIGGRGRKKEHRRVGEYFQREGEKEVRQLLLLRTPEVVKSISKQKVEPGLEVGMLQLQE